VDHPSCSRQHAVIQYRVISTRDDVGNITKEVKPYVMDLESTNSTFLGKEKIEPCRYYELKNYDLINFGFSTRDYILIKVEEVDDAEQMKKFNITNN
jgi:smad nuclear-interacting protein 1